MGSIDEWVHKLDALAEKGKEFRYGIHTASGELLSSIYSWSGIRTVQLERYFEESAPDEQHFQRMLELAWPVKSGTCQ